MRPQKILEFVICLSLVLGLIAPPITGWTETVLIGNPIDEWWVCSGINALHLLDRLSDFLLKPNTAGISAILLNVSFAVWLYRFIHLSIIKWNFSEMEFCWRDSIMIAVQTLTYFFLITAMPIATLFVNRHVLLYLARMYCLQSAGIEFCIDILSWAGAGYVLKLCIPFFSERESEIVINSTARRR